MLIPDSSQEQRSDPKQTFLRYLPERVEAIEDGWRTLVDKGWSSAKLAQLLQRSKDLASVAGQFGLARLNDGLLPLIQSLHALLEIKQPPSPQQIEQVNNLLQRFIMLYQDNGRTKDSAATDAQLQRPPVFYLCSNEMLAPALTSALASIHCPLVRFNSSTELLRRFNEKTPSALIVDAKMLPQLAPSLMEMAKNANPTSKVTPALIVLSTLGSLEVRLLALRAGAVGFFLAPIDVQAVVERIYQFVAPNPEAPYRVLVMDDDSSQADFAAAILRKNGLDSRTVTDPAQLLEVIGEFAPDLVLMDLYMPDLNGLELTRIIREQTNFISLPIVFMSGEQDADKQLDALSVGGDDFITKPVRPRRLLTLVKSRIIRSRASQQHNTEPSHRDPMTGLLSRLFLFEQVDRILASGTQALAHGLFYLEVDGMEAIRTAVGTGLAEVFLTGLGARTLTLLGPKILCARVDDNRFAILASRPQESDLVQLGEDLVQTIAQRRLPVEGINTQPSLSVGLYRFIPAPKNTAELEEQAIAACDKAKRNGGNRLIVKSSVATSARTPTTTQTLDPVSVPVSADSQRPKPTEILALIRQAMLDNQFQVQFQKFANLRDPQRELQEMQWRWVNQAGNPLNSAEILALAKQSPGLSRDIDRWLVSKALDVLRENRQTGRQVGLLVHQTVETITDQQTAAWLRNELRRRLLVGTGLILKFNLADMVVDIKGVRDLMGELAIMGVEMCLGSFGHNDTSYKVLNYLKVPYVKIPDKLLVADAETISILLGHIRESNSKLILSRTQNPRVIAKGWLSGADFVQSNAVVT